MIDFLVYILILAVSLTLCGLWCMGVDKLERKWKARKNR